MPNEIANMTPDLLTFAIVLVAGRVLKSVPNIKDWLIPILLLILGSGMFAVLSTPWNPRNLASGFIIAATAIGLYGAAKQAVVTRVEDAGSDPHNTATGLLFGTTPKTDTTTTQPTT